MFSRGIDKGIIGIVGTHQLALILATHFARAGCVVYIFDAPYSYEARSSKGNLAELIDDSCLIERIYEKDLESDWFCWRDCHLIFECLCDHLEVKSRFYQQFHHAISPDTYIFSSIESITLTELYETLPSGLRCRVLGIFYANLNAIESTVEILCPVSLPSNMQQTLLSFLKDYLCWHVFFETHAHELKLLPFLVNYVAMFLDIATEFKLPCDILEELTSKILFKSTRGFCSFVDRMGLGKLERWRSKIGLYHFPCWVETLIEEGGLDNQKGSPMIYKEKGYKQSYDPFVRRYRRYQLGIDHSLERLGMSVSFSETMKELYLRSDHQSLFCQKILSHLTKIFQEMLKSQKWTDREVHLVCDKILGWNETLFYEFIVSNPPTSPQYFGIDPNYLGDYQFFSVKHIRDQAIWIVEIMNSIWSLDVFHHELSVIVHQATREGCGILLRCSHPHPFESLEKKLADQSYLGFWGAEVSLILDQVFDCGLLLHQAKIPVVVLGYGVLKGFWLELALSSFIVIEPSSCLMIEYDRTPLLSLTFMMRRSLRHYVTGAPWRRFSTIGQTDLSVPLADSGLLGALDIVASSKQHVYPLACTLIERLRYPSQEKMRSGIMMSQKKLKELYPKMQEKFLIEYEAGFLCLHQRRLLRSYVNFMKSLTKHPLLTLDLLENEVKNTWKEFYTHRSLIEDSI